MTEKTVIIIEARGSGLIALLREIKKYSSFYLFLLHEISMKKWKHTFLGFWWLVLRPLIPTAMAIVTFTFIAPMENYGLPYAVFYLSGYVTWHLLHASVAFMPRTMLWMRGIMKKAYFPKILVPLASIGPPLIEMAIVFAALLASIIIFYAVDGVVYVRWGWDLLLLPMCLLVTLLMSIGIGMVTSVMALFVRDTVYSVTYFVQVLMFLTPVLYPITFVPEGYRWIVYLLNPVAKLVETSRWALTGHGVFDPMWLAVSCTVALMIFVGGSWFFLKVEPLLADAL